MSVTINPPDTIKVVLNAITNTADIIAALNSLQANVGDASIDTLKSVIAKLGNDPLTVKARLDALASLLEAIPTNPLLASSYVAPDNADIALIKAKTDTIPAVPLGTADIAVKAKNAAGNTDIVDVIGQKTDDESGNSLYAYENILRKHTHSASKVYPTLANGITVTGAAGAWTLGAFAVIVPANTIPSIFDIHHINISAYNANDVFELVLYSGPDGSEVEIGRVRFTRISNVGASPHVLFISPLIAANSQIKAKIATQAGTSNTATISIMYHTY